MIAIEDCVQMAVRGLEVYVHGSEERMLQAAREDRVDGLEAASVLKKTKRNDCKIVRRKLYIFII